MVKQTAPEVFSGNEYHTPDDLSVSWILRTPRLGSLWFHLMFVFGLLRRSRRLALRNQFDEKAHKQAAFHYFRHIEKAGGKFHVTGLENLEKTSGPVVITANHMSLCETFVLPAMITPRKGKHSFVIKHSLTRYPLFGPVIRATHPVAVTRNNPRQDLKTVMRDGVRFLEEGRTVTIFPQTRRRQDFKRSEFNTLGERLAEKAGVQVVPLALKTDFLTAGRIIPDFGPIYPERHLHFAFGEPLGPGGNLKEKHREIIKFIETKLSQWGASCKE